VTSTDALLIDYGRKASRTHLEPALPGWTGTARILGAEWHRDAIVAPQRFNTAREQRTVPDVPN
jgi:hypothetical protein